MRGSARETNAALEAQAAVAALTIVQQWLRLQHMPVWPQLWDEVVLNALRLHGHQQPLTLDGG